MELLPQQNKVCEGDTVPNQILANGKRVVIIGGGDTGADCLGTVHRQKPISVHQFELLPMPPKERSQSTPWPLWPMQLRIEGAHEEGGVREWSVATAGFTGDENSNVKQLHGLSVGPPSKFEPIPGTEFAMDVDLVLLAMGFLGPFEIELVAGTLQKEPPGRVAEDREVAVIHGSKHSFGLRFLIQRKSRVD